MIYHIHELQKPLQIIVVKKLIYKFNSSAIKKNPLPPVKLAKDEMCMFSCFFQIEIEFRIKITEFWTACFEFSLSSRFQPHSFSPHCKFLSNLRCFLGFVCYPVFNLSSVRVKLHYQKYPSSIFLSVREKLVFEHLLFDRHS